MAELIASVSNHGRDLVRIPRGGMENNATRILRQSTMDRKVGRNSMEWHT